MAKTESFFRTRSAGFPGLVFAAFLALTFGACAKTPESKPSEAEITAPIADEPSGPESIETWQCRNDLEILCQAGTCEATEADSFTPASVQVSSDGGVSVCLYSGCWEGRGDVSGHPEFLIVVGRDLAFSTAPDTTSQQQDLVVVVDRADGIGTLKAGEFALPLVCEQPD